MLGVRKLAVGWALIYLEMPRVPSAALRTARRLFSLQAAKVHAVLVANIYFQAFSKISLAFGTSLFSKRACEFRRTANVH